MKTLIAALLLLFASSPAYALPWADTMPLIATACATANFAPIMGWTLNSGSVPISIVSTLGATIPGMTEVDRQSVAASMAASGCVIPPKPASVIAWEVASQSGGSSPSSPPPASCSFRAPGSYTAVYIAGDSRASTISTKASPCANCNTGEHKWPNLLREYTNATIIAGASPGTSSATAATSQLAQALSMGADLFLVETGANDATYLLTPAQTQANIAAIIAGRGSMDVAIIGLGPGITSGDRAAYQAAIEAAVAGACAIYFDGLTPFRSLYRTPAEPYSTDDIPDGIHYSARGARKRAEQIGNGLFR